MSADSSTRVAVVTGALGGLGRALTAELVAAGWQVVAATRAPDSAAAPPRICLVPLDVTDQQHIDEAVSTILTRFHRIDLLVNNAGVTADAALAQMSEEDWTRVIDVNLNGAFRCARAVARQMIRQRDGHIMNIASHSALFGPRGQANYAAAKAGLIGLTQSLARELGSRNVRVNAILPGVLPTRMTAHLGPERMENFARANALGRINSLGEVARFVGFLATTRNISGQVFALDSRIAPWT